MKTPVTKKTSPNPAKTPEMVANMTYQTTSKKMVANMTYQPSYPQATRKQKVANMTHNGSEYDPPTPKMVANVTTIKNSLKKKEPTTNTHPKQKATTQKPQTQKPTPKTTTKNRVYAYTRADYTTSPGRTPNSSPRTPKPSKTTPAGTCWGTRQGET